MVEEDFNVSEDTLICAFDYACGKKKFVAGPVARDLLDNADRLTRAMRHHIISKINELERLRMLGHRQDAEQWHNLRNRLKEIESEVQA